MFWKSSFSYRRNANITGKGKVKTRLRRQEKKSILAAGESGITRKIQLYEKVLCA
jgi:hypothetical protein